MAEELEDLTDEMKAAVGQETGRSTYEVTTQGIRTFARSVGYKDPKYFDESAARALGYSGLPSPPGFLGMPIFNPNAGDEGARRELFKNPFERRLNGGTEVEPIEQVYGGDVLDAVSRITTLELTQSRLGKMLIQNSETVYTRKSDNKVVAKTRGTGLSY
ncbi:MAG: MaoC family dehydratase N-terminal domain-containing protein [Chloroflexi bacterium]|nr:MaoC family dehydratase N-terminal domain-containing protein [Chloroflexota bacterium]MDA1146190.1 MaoC family dehydratase N-terminal domain-containing protein [Chloroflexota bacterium]